MVRTGLLLLMTLWAPVVEEKTAADWLARASKEFQEGDFEASSKSVTRCLKLSPRNPDALDLRGAVHFMQGKFAESVADFDRAIELSPERANGHWRRGISLYYAGEFAKGARQFEGYEKVDTNDVENAVWHWMCNVRMDGHEKAAGRLLKIGKDRRVPMMQVYALLQGKCKTADVLAAAQAGDVPATQRQSMLFYAHLYIGIYHDLNKERAKAIEHLELAAGKYRIAHYMGQVARIHLEELRKAGR